MEALFKIPLACRPERCAAGFCGGGEDLISTGLQVSRKRIRAGRDVGSKRLHRLLPLQARREPAASGRTTTVVLSLEYVCIPAQQGIAWGRSA